MRFTEQELEDVLFQELTKEDESLLYQKGFDLYYDKIGGAISTSVSRQVDLSPYGIADILVQTIFKDHILIDVIELKVNPLKPKDINQVLRYKKAIERFYEHSTHDDIDGLGVPNIEMIVRPVLITEGISGGHYILNEMTEYGLKFYTYQADPINGISFENRSNSVWSIDEGVDHIEKMGSQIMYEEACKIIKGKVEEADNG